MKHSLTFIASLVLLANACAPKVYLVDRQTVLEVQSSGDWPELDRAATASAMEPGPKALRKTSDTPDKRAALRVLPSDESTKTAAPR